MLETERLILRQWQDSDIEPFVALNQDACVMAYFPATYDAAHSRNFIDHCRAAIDERGWGFWAVEERSSQHFIGMVGLNNIPDELPIEYEIEVGWRLAHRFWGQGYATEAARISLEYAFTQLQCDNVIAYTPTSNLRSMRVMQKLQMQRLPTTFMHPRVAPETGLSAHVIYLAVNSQHKGK